MAEEADQSAEDIERVRVEIRDALVDAAIAWLEEKWGLDRRCPYCDVLDWGVNSPLDDYLWEEGPISAHFEVTCANCGHTVFVNAFKSGLLPSDPEEIFESPFEDSE